MIIKIVMIDYQDSDDNLKKKDLKIFHWQW